MIPILFEKNETSFKTNGLARLSDCISCVVTEERNGIYECDFEYPADGANFELIQPGRIIYAWHDDSKKGQPFDIVSYSKPLNGIVSFHAVHVSYRLQGHTGVGVIGVNDLAFALVEMKQASEPVNQFTFWTDKTNTGYMASSDGTPRTIRQFLGGVEGSILDSYGGEFEFDAFTVKLWSARGKARDFAIRYGVNLLDYQDDTDYHGTYTSCVPFWKGLDEDGGNVIVVGTKVSSGQISYNGRDVTLPLDLSDKFEEKPTEADLESYAYDYMRRERTALPATTIAIDFINLADNEELETLSNLYTCHLCDTVKVDFPTYGVSASYKLVRVEYDTLNEKYNRVELGRLSTSLAEALGISNSDVASAGGAGGDLSVNDLFVKTGLYIETFWDEYQAGTLPAGTDYDIDDAINTLGWTDVFV